MLKGRRAKKPYQKKQAVSFTGDQWQEILFALDIYLMGLNDEDEYRTQVIREIDRRILARVVLPSTRVI
jgi:hypothetical protein